MYMLEQNRLRKRRYAEALRSLQCRHSSLVPVPRVPDRVRVRHSRLTGIHPEFVGASFLGSYRYEPRIGTRLRAAALSEGAQGRHGHADCMPRLLSRLPKGLKL